MQSQSKFVKRARKLREWNMSRTTGWRRERDDPTVPRPILLGPGLVVYDAAACDEWERSQVATTPQRRQERSR